MDTYNQLLGKIKSSYKGDNPNIKKALNQAKPMEKAKPKEAPRPVPKAVAKPKVTTPAGHAVPLNDRQKYKEVTKQGYAQALKDSAAARFHAGVMNGIFPVDTKGAIGQTYGNGALNAINQSKAYSAGSIAGIMGQFAVPYAGAAPAIGKLATKVPQIAKMGKVGQAVARSAATDIAVGLPLNVNYAVNKEGLRGKEAIKSIGVNTAIDLVAGGLIEVVPSGVKGIKHLVDRRTQKVVAQATDETVEAAIGRIVPEPPKQTKTDVAVPAKDLGADIARPQKTSEELIKEYGIIEPGMEPRARTAQMPKATDAGKVQKGIRTSAEARAVSDEAYREIQAAVEEGMATNYGVKNESVVNKASKTIENFGLNEAHDKFKSAVHSNKTPTSEDVALGYRLMQEHQKAGDFKRVADIAIDVSEMLSEAGRTLQASTIIKKLSPEGRLTSVQRVAKRLSDKHGVDIKLDDETVDKILKAVSEKEVTQATQDAAVKVWNQVPSGIQEKLNAWRYMSMLMNPKTHVRNIIGNAIFMPARALKNVIGAGLETVAKPLANGTKADFSKTKAILNPASKTDREYLKIANSDFSEVVGILRGETKFDEGYRELGARVFKSRVLEGLRKFNMGALDVEDVVFMQAAYDSSFAQYLKANNINPKTIDFSTIQKARNYAADEALRATYRDASTLANGISRLKRNMATSKPESAGLLAAQRVAGVALEGIMPFTKTPINILKRGVEYSPVGILGGISNVIKVAKRGGDMAKALDRLAAGLSGTGIMALGAYMAKQKLVVGGNEGAFNDKASQYSSMQGMQEYALDTGDGTYTLDWAAPMSMPFFSGVEIGRALMNEGASFESIIDAMTKLDEPLFNMSMLQGINDALSTWGNGEGALGEIASNMIIGYLGQYVPTVGGQIARTIDDTRRATVSTDESSTRRKVEKAAQRQMNKVPGLSERNEPYIDLWGRTETNGSAFQNFINPGYYKPKNETGVDMEINRLIGKLPGETGRSIIPRATTSYDIKKDGEDYRMTEKELTQFKTARGQYSKRELAKLFETEGYKNLSADEKAKAITGVYDDAYREAHREVYGAKQALRVHSEKAYQKASKIVGGGITYDLYYDTYFKLGDVHSDKGKNGKSVAAGSKAERSGQGKSASVKKRAYIDSIPNLTAQERAKLYDAFEVAKSVREYRIIVPTKK